MTNEMIALIGERNMLESQRYDLAALLRKLINSGTPGRDAEKFHKMRDKCADYLKRHGLEGSAGR